jgi:hypothetical protein
MRATCQAQSIILHLTVQTKLHEEYKLQNFWLCNVLYLATCDTAFLNNKLLTPHEIRRFITAFTGPYYVPYKSNPHPHTLSL